MFGRASAEREAEWVRHSVGVAVEYLLADDDAALERVLRRADVDAIQWGVVQIALRAVAALAEARGATPAEVVAGLGDEVTAAG